MNDRTRRMGRAGFTLVELLAVVAVIVILMALLLPTIGAARQSSRISKCAHHLSELSAALTKAALRAPVSAAAQWPVELTPYVDAGGALFRCPDDDAAANLPSFGLSTRTFRMQGGDDHKLVMLDYRKPAADVVGKNAADPAQWTSGTTVAPRHRQKVNVLAFGGAVQLRTLDAIDPRDCDIHDHLWRPVRDSSTQWDRPNCDKLLSLTPTITTGGETTTTTTGAPPPPPCPSLAGRSVMASVAVSPASAHEGSAGQSTPIQATVTLSEPVASGTITVQVATEDGTATAGGDYTATSELVTFHPGETSKNLLTSPIIQSDIVHEPDEDFTVNVTSPLFNNQTCPELTVSSPATVTIYNDDPPPADPCQQAQNPPAVDPGLNWLVRHQFSNGSWSLRHSVHPECLGQCNGDSIRLPTPVGSPIAATAVALLPLLGAGHAPGSGGQYEENVCRGLNFLMTQQNPTTGSLAESTYVNGRVMYTHLFATLALLEALQLSRDVQSQSSAHCGGSTTACTLDMNLLQARASLAVDATLAFRSDAARFFSWDYGGGTTAKGCLSMHQWALAVLKDAQKAGLTQVTDADIQKFHSFLDHAQRAPTVSENGWTLGNYSYVDGPGLWAGITPSMTAGGLWMRIQLGAPVGHQKVQDFVGQVDLTPWNAFSSAPKFKPWLGEPYYNCNMTRLLLRVGGAQWNQWESELKDHLIATQSQTGHTQGSWHWSSCPCDSRCASEWNITGGRHYCTVFSLLALEQFSSRLKFTQ